MIGLFPSWTIPSLPLSFLWLISSLNLLTISNTPCLHDKHTRLHHHGSPSTSAISSLTTQKLHKQTISCSLFLYTEEKMRLSASSKWVSKLQPQSLERDQGSVLLCLQGLIKETLSHSCSGPYGRICLLLAGTIKFELELSVSAVTSSTWSVKCERQRELPFKTHFTSKCDWFGVTRILMRKNLGQYLILCIGNWWKRTLRTRNLFTSLLIVFFKLNIIQ